MTFTRKAAGEMKARIIEALNRGQDVSTPEKAHQKTTWNLATVALERNHKFGWRLLENPARLRVVTIDSFCSFRRQSDKRQVKVPIPMVQISI